MMRTVHEEDHEYIRQEIEKNRIEDYDVEKSLTKSLKKINKETETFLIIQKIINENLKLHKNTLETMDKLHDMIKYCDKMLEQRKT